jgi:hypothetical protein
MISYLMVVFFVFLSLVDVARAAFRGTRGISYRTLQKGVDLGKKEGMGGGMDKMKRMGMDKDDELEDLEEPSPPVADTESTGDEEDTDEEEDTKHEDEDDNYDEQQSGKKNDKEVVSSGGKEVEVDVCDPNPCVKGDCVSESSPDEDVEKPMCSCHPGYVGQFCDITDPCLALPCQNNSTCQSLARSDGEYSCECDKVHVGRHCQYKDPCFPNNPCRNGGYCVVLLGSIVDGVPMVDCACAEGFGGKNCETKST